MGQLLIYHFCILPKINHAAKHCLLECPQSNRLLPVVTGGEVYENKNMPVLFKEITKLIEVFNYTKVKVKVGVLRPVQQPGSYWDRSSELPLVGLEPTEVTAYD